MLPVRSLRWWAVVSAIVVAVYAMGVRDYGRRQSRKLTDLDEEAMSGPRVPDDTYDLSGVILPDHKHDRGE
jgi:hypothetical protein